MIHRGSNLMLTIPQIEAKEEQEHKKAMEQAMPNRDFISYCDRWDQSLRDLLTRSEKNEAKVANLMDWAVNTARKHRGPFSIALNAVLNPYHARIRCAERKNRSKVIDTILEELKCQH